MNFSLSDLEGKKVLVTGASRGIGKAICEALARQKAHVVFNLSPNSKHIVDELKSHYESLGGKATGLIFDVTNSEEMKKSIDSFLETHGEIIGLVNNAGFSKDALALRLKDEDIEKTLSINLAAVMKITSYLTRTFLKAQNVSVVNMSSVVGLMGNPGQHAYCASKAGIIGFTKSYAKEMGTKNIRCNAICPGFIETDMTHSLSLEVKENYYNAIPLKRFGKAEEVANLTCFLLSQASSYITGEIIKIDGGLYI